MRALRLLAVFAVTATLIYLAVLIGGTVLLDALGVPDQNGGTAMALAFFVAPLAALPGGIACAWLLRRH